MSAGHYFLWSKTDGGYVEVSRPFWEWIRLQGLSLFVTHPLAMLGMAFLLFRFVFASRIAGGSHAASAEQQLRASGPLMASGRSGGRIGDINFSGPMLRVEVFPGGLLLKPLFMTAHVIRASAIRSVSWRRSMLLNHLEIAHAGEDVRSPVQLYLKRTDPVALAIESLASASSAATESISSTPTEAQSLPPSTSPFAAMPPGMAFGLQALGIVVSAVLIGFGILWAIPQLGVPGWIWTGFIVLITAVNARRVVRGWR